MRENFAVAFLAPTGHSPVSLLLRLQTLKLAEDSLQILFSTLDRSESFFEKGASALAGPIWQSKLISPPQKSVTELLLNLNWSTYSKSSEPDRRTGPDIARETIFMVLKSSYWRDGSAVRRYTSLPGPTFRSHHSCLAIPLVFMSTCTVCARTI